MVFDDEVSLHQDMKEYLGEAYEAAFVNDLQEALEVLGGTDSFSAVFVSSPIASADHFSLLDEIKKLQSSAKIFLLCYNRREQEIENFKAAKRAEESNLVAQVLAKPLDQIELGIALQAHLGRSRRRCIFQWRGWQDRSADRVATKSANEPVGLCSFGL